MSKIVNEPRDYAWGSTTLIAQLQGRGEPDAPEAEVWFGDHHRNPAVLEDGRPLTEVTGGRLPFLLKLLAAASPLSIQVHPSVAQAREGLAREATLAPAERLYSDAHHKPEIIVALTDFEALAGMREPADSAALVATLGDAASPLLERLRSDEQPVAAAVRWALAEASKQELSAISEAIASSSAEELVAARSVARQHPADAGVVVALLMNHVRLAPGEAMFTPAGRVHAYLSGLGVEAMSASDNVLRGGLTHKRIDVPEFLAISDLAPVDVEVQRPDDTADTVEFDIPVPDFSLRRIRVSAKPREIALASACVVLCVEGEVSVASGSDTVTISAGEAAYASVDSVPLTLSGTGDVFIAS